MEVAVGPRCVEPRGFGFQCEWNEPRWHVACLTFVKGCSGCFIETQMQGPKLGAREGAVHSPA